MRDDDCLGKLDGCYQLLPAAGSLNNIINEVGTEVQDPEDCQTPILCCAGSVVVLGGVSILPSIIFAIGRLSDSKQVVPALCPELAYLEVPYFRNTKSWRQSGNKRNSKLTYTILLDSFGQISRCFYLY